MKNTHRYNSPSFSRGANRSLSLVVERGQWFRANREPSGKRGGEGEREVGDQSAGSARYISHLHV